MSAAETSSPDPRGTPIMLDGRVAIYPSEPLPGLASPAGTAYAAQMKAYAGIDMMAVVCSNGLIPRIDTVSAMRTIDNPGIIRLRESGLLHWPASGSTFFCLTFERPVAPRYWNSLSDTQPVMSEDTLNHSFVIPLINLLLDLQRTGIVHTNIRPNNIFWRHASATPPQLGECLSMPPGYGQPVLFETIERGLCTPMGRGPGSHTDDCYALGITIACVALGLNPMAGVDDATILQHKMEKGSFTTMIGNRRLAPSHIELLRGLLADDARQRWTATDLEQWMTGRRLTPKSSDAGRRATRHFDVGGKEYWQVRPLAHALANNIPDAIKVIESGALEKWLMRSLGDEDRSKAVTEAIALIKEGGKIAHAEDQLVSRVCIALDPAAPIRYKGLAVMPSGLANLLADAMMTGSNIQTASELLSGPYISAWATAQKDMPNELLPVLQQLDRARSYVDRMGLGNGIERVIYEINPHLPCLSPMLRTQYVASPKTICQAMENISRAGARAQEPMDRHIAAFLLVRDKRSEALFAAMTPTESPARRGLAMLTLYSELQYRYGPDKAPGLAAWIAPLIEPLVRRFLNKPLQDKVRREVKDATDKGNLGALLRAVDDQRRVQNDEYEFVRARQMFQELSKEIAQLENALQSRGDINRTTGRPMAATIASMISMTLIALTLIRLVLLQLRGG